MFLPPVVLLSSVTFMNRCSLRLSFDIQLILHTNQTQVVLPQLKQLNAGPGQCFYILSCSEERSQYFSGLCQSYFSEGRRLTGAAQRESPAPLISQEEDVDAVELQTAWGLTSCPTECCSTATVKKHEAARPQLTPWV